MKKLFSVIIVIFALVSCSKDIELTNQAWTYDKGICTVEFSIKNNKDYDAIRRIRITAFSLKDIGMKTIVSYVIGKKTFYIALKPREEKKYTGTINLFLNIRPDMVVISHSEDKR